MKTQTTRTNEVTLRPLFERPANETTLTLTGVCSASTVAPTHDYREVAVNKSKNTMLLGTLRRSTILGLAVMAFLALALSAQAGNLVVNGGFETTTNGPCQFDYCTTAPPWSSSGYAFIFGYGTGDTTGSNGWYGGLTLWGPHNGSNNGMPAGSPGGGNFVGTDGAWDVQPIQQTINGLTVGDQYNVSFWWAGAQEFAVDGDTTEQWQVSLGNQTLYTSVLPNPSHGFTGWKYESLTFTADNSSDVLSFLAVGTPQGTPPFVLLDGVTMNAVPEPGTLALSVGGLLGIVGTLRSRNWLKR